MRHVVDLGALVVGRRVVVRYRLPDGSASDALGDLVDADGERLVVRTRRGDVAVARAAVLAVRAVPPPPARRPRRAPEPPHIAVGVDELELLAAEHWRPTERVDLGQWQLRAAGGFTGRANSALAVGSPGCPLDVAVSRVEEFYAARSLPPVVAVPDSAAAVAEELAGRGWTVRTPTLVMTAATDDLPHPDGAVQPEGTVQLDGEPDDAWLAAYRGRGEVTPQGRSVLVSADDVVFASVRDGAGAVLAIARGSLSRGPAGTWVGLAAVETDPSHRRRGLGRRVTAAAAAWGRERGAGSAFLQVAAGNNDAVALYGALGFTVHHGYHYRVAPASPPR